jgi:hypothetical protein
VPLFLVRLGAWWVGTAWPFLKKNWRWLLLFPVMLVVWAWGRRAGSVTVVNDDHESDEAERFRAAVEAKAAEDVRLLERKRSEEVQEVLQGVSISTEAQLDDQETKAADLINDPKKLNTFLHDVGKRQRQ